MKHAVDLARHETMVLGDLGNSYFIGARGTWNCISNIPTIMKIIPCTERGSERSIQNVSSDFSLVSESIVFLSKHSP